MKAYNQGYGDFVKGNVVNPYSVDSYNYKEWERGFNRAYFRNLEWVNEREAKKKAPST